MPRATAGKQAGGNPPATPSGTILGNIGAGGNPPAFNRLLHLARKLRRACMLSAAHRPSDGSAGTSIQRP